MRLLMKLVHTEYEEHFSFGLRDQYEFAGRVTAAFLEIDSILAGNVIGYDKISEPSLVRRVDWP